MKAKNRKALARIRALASAIANAPDVVLPAAAKAIGTRTRSLISEGFDKRQAPNGTAWAQREENKPWPLLEQTRKMRRGWRVFVSDKGAIARNRDPKTRFHQKGTRYMKARPMIPNPGRLPERWRVAILRSVVSAASRAMRKGMGL